MNGAQIGWIAGLACLLHASHVLAAGEAKLINERLVFPPEDDSWRVEDTRRPVMRLSPNGTTLLCVERRAAANGTGHEWHLRLRDLASGRDDPVPIPPRPWGWATMHAASNPFDPAGRTLLVVTPTGPDTRKIELYDIAKRRLLPTKIEGASVYARFDRTGKRLIVCRAQAIAVATLPGLEMKACRASGMLHSVCPTADVVCIFAVRSARHIGPPGGLVTIKRDLGLALYDIEADKQIADLPVHNDNWAIDTRESQWTHDGRFLYYCDFDPRGDDPSREAAVTRVWDREAGKQVGVVQGCEPVGPGPTPTTMVLRKRDAHGAYLVLHDGSCDKQWLLGRFAAVQHAWGSKAIYVRLLPDRRESVHVADIAPPKPPNGRP